VENTKMKILTNIIVKIWLIIGNVMALFFIFSPKERSGISFSGVIAGYCIISFFVNWLDQRYCPERSVSRLSKVITVIMIIGMFTKCAWIN
jgi:hypothetical protein